MPQDTTEIKIIISNLKKQLYTNMFESLKENNLPKQSKEDIENLFKTTERKEIPPNSFYEASTTSIIKPENDMTKREI